MPIHVNRSTSLPPSRRWAVAILYEAATGRTAGDPVDCSACGARHPQRCLVDFQPLPHDPSHLLIALCRHCEGAGTWEDFKRAERVMVARRPGLLCLSNDGEQLILVVDPDWNTKTHGVRR